MKLLGLVVDDDGDSRQQVLVALQSAAQVRGDWLDIHEAKTALGAARLAKEFTPDFAILDYDLPNGLTGIQLAISLIERQKDLLVCMFSAKDETIVDMALQSAFGKSTASVQYKAKPVTMVEWRNFYELTRKDILRSRNEFLFDDLDDLCRRAYSDHERLRLLNLLGERATRTAAATFGAFFPAEIASFVRTRQGRPFITASSFMLLAEKLASMLLSSDLPETQDANIRHLANSLKDKFIKSVRFVLKLENDSKHHVHMQEEELRRILAQNGDMIEWLHEFIADLRNVSFFAKEQDSEYCNRLIWYNRSKTRTEEFDLVLRPALSSAGALVGDKYLDIRPLMKLERCDLCKRVHPFHLNRVDADFFYYGWPCSATERRVPR
jgi:CheY-like chemotaxis protein